ncbi:MAG: metal ABC transporter permease [Planctomycetaceae bacterium]|jgi:zinc transport system permease protein|nr:metal ABC transporter permease [Planctomycetaceae bacterium]
MRDIFCSPIIIQAFIIGGLSAVAFGLIGVFIVVRRIGYLAGAIAHCAFGGIGIGIGLQYIVTLNSFVIFRAFIPDPMFVAMIVAIISAMLIGVIRIVSKEREDTVIGAIWASGMAIGLFLVAIVPNNRNISDYLFGTIIFNTREDVFSVLLVSVIVLLVMFLFFKRFEAVCFDEEFSRLKGVNTAFYFQLLLILTAITVVVLVRIVGIVLVIAMLTLPAATACRFTSRISSACILAVIVGFISNWIGLFASVFFNLPPGPTIVIVASLLYFISLVVTKSSTA